PSSILRESLLNFASETECFGSPFDSFLDRFMLGAADAKLCWYLWGFCFRNGEWFRLGNSDCRNRWRGRYLLFCRRGFRFQRLFFDRWSLRNRLLQGRLGFPQRPQSCLNLRPRNCVFFSRSGNDFLASNCRFSFVQLLWRVNREVEIPVAA